MSPLLEPEVPTPATPVEPPKSRRILYVVHRYAPYPGGSENYVKDMAEETMSRGHTVAVFAGEHMGDHHGVRVSSDPQILMEQWDLIVVHGGDVAVQNFVLERADRLGGPVLYMLILPSHSATCIGALRRAKYVGCSTLADWRYVTSYNARDRSVKVRHGIDAKISLGHPGFRASHGIKTPYMFLSAGGFWPNKAFEELVEVFKSTQRTDVTLVLTGYDDRYHKMTEDSEFVKSFMVYDRRIMLSALVEADLYILNSYSEGFGLVLLEAMLNMTPWVGREIAGAELMREYGVTYKTPKELQAYLQKFTTTPPVQLQDNMKYVLSSHLVRHTVNDIHAVLA